MTQVRSWAGLDVHAAKVLAVTVDRESGEMRSRRLSGRTSEVVEFCTGLPGPTRVAYEAGPTGFTLARALTDAGVQCVIAAPGKIERPAQDRVKTDRRDAERLVRLLMVDGLHPVRVPSTEEAWKAQQRLHHTWRRLDSERGKRKTIVAVAVARELAGFCWAIANAD
jgi:transposase